MRIGQIHGAAIGAESQAVGRDQRAQLQVGRAAAAQLSRAQAKHLAYGFGCAHVHEHGAGQKAALAVAAAIVETHAGQRMRHLGQRLHCRIGTAFAGGDLVDTVFQPGHPALCIAAPCGHAGQHLRQLPLGQLLLVCQPAVEHAARDIRPIQRLFGHAPHRAFAGGVACIQNQFGAAHALLPSSPNGPCAVNAPPW